MGSTSILIRGTLKPDGTLELDERPPLPPGRVEILLRSMNEPIGTGPGAWEVLQQIHKEQPARGYTGMTEEDWAVREAEQRAEDEEDQEYWRKIWSQTTSTAEKQP
jgi:hypothetical protein